MNDVQNLIDRQLGLYCQLNYDNILKRLVVDYEESFYGLQSTSNNAVASFDQDPPIFACRFSEAPGYEHILALANEDGRVAIQNTTNKHTASTLDSFQCHNNAVFDLAWMPGHMSFVTVSGDHTACLWDVAEGAPKRVLVFSNHTRSVKTAVFQPNSGSVFATGARDGHILVWDIRASPQPALQLKPDNCLLGCHARFTPKTPGSHSKRPRVDPGRAISITGLAFRDPLTLLSCGECDGNIKAWDLRKNYNVYTREPLPKHSIPYCGSSTRNGYTNLVVDDARVRLYASCMDNVIYCFNVATYTALPERRYVGHENGTFYIKTGLSPDCAYLVSGSSDRGAYVWNVRRSEPLVRLAGHRAEVTCAAWSRDARHTLVTCSDDARHMIWRIGAELPALHDDPARRPPGRAEPVPRADADADQWLARDHTPTSLKRRAATTPSSHQAPAKLPRPQAQRSSKRCLADLLTAEPAAAKRPRPPDEEPRLLPAGIKRPRDLADPADPAESPPGAGPAEWSYVPPAAGGGFVTPTKGSGSRGREAASPEPPSPPKVRVVSFGTPTKNLPDFVLNGEAPHLRLMSPLKKKQDTTNWLTLIVRERRGRAPEGGEGPPVAAPLSPKENVPSRRNSVADRASKPTKKSRTLLKYFSVAGREK